MSLSSIIIIITLIFGNRVNENHHDTRPSGLMVEFIRDPSGVPILDLLPEFTWIVPAEAEKQTAYRIIVSSSRNEIN
ncbi:MAG TPA: hypothetical protein VHO46_10820, partial [Bacteroidales bacterium]|nr:hypothetical protein [Bacteroidales bacterium]